MSILQQKSFDRNQCPDTDEWVNWVNASLDAFLSDDVDPLDFANIKSTVEAKGASADQARVMFKNYIKTHATQEQIDAHTDYRKAQSQGESPKITKEVRDANRILQYAHAATLVWLQEGDSVEVDDDAESADLDKKERIAKQMYDKFGGYEKRPGFYDLHCPCAHHEDNNPSLRVDATHEQSSLPFVRCLALDTDGNHICGFKDVVKAIEDAGIEWDRGGKGQPKNGTKGESPTPVLPVPDTAEQAPIEHPVYGNPTHTWAYRDTQGRLMYYVYRFDFDGKKDCERLIYTKQGWIFADPDQHQIYGLDRLAKNNKRSDIVFHEGEKAADAGYELLKDYVNLTWSGGASQIDYVDFTPLDGHPGSIIIMADADSTGAGAAEKLAKILWGHGHHDISIVRHPQDVADKWDIADALEAGWSREEAYRYLLHNKEKVDYTPNGGPRDITSQDDLVTAMDKINRVHAHVTISNKQMIIWEHQGKWGSEVKTLSHEDFKKKYARLPQIWLDDATNPNGGKWEQPAKIWLESHLARDYDTAEFLPGEGDKEDVFNLWRGWGVEPDWSLDDPRDKIPNWLYHTEQLIAGGDEYTAHYIKSWLAAIVQNPQVGPGTALVLQAGQGTGKTSWVQTLAPIFGNNMVTASDQSHITGNFNAHLETCLLLFGEEAFAPGDKRAESQLKMLVGNPNGTLPIERKGVDMYQANNYVNMVLVSNDEWVVPAGTDDRRWCVVEVNDSQQRNKAFFKQVKSEIENEGGAEALLAYLLQYDYSDIDFEEFPETMIREKQKEHSWSIEQKWLVDILDSGLNDLMTEDSTDEAQRKADVWDDEVGVKATTLHDSLNKFARSVGGKRVPSVQQMSKIIREHVPSAYKEKSRKWTRGNKRVIVLPDADTFKDELAESLGVSVDNLIE